MKLRLLVFLAIFCSALLYAQEDWIRKEFVAELREDIKDNVYAQHKRVGNQFIRYFNGSSFDEGQEEYIYRLVNQLRRKRFNDAADFYELFRLVKSLWSRRT